MKNADCVEFLQWALPQLRLRWQGFRKVRGQVCKRIDRRMKELGLAGVAAYRDYLTSKPAEWSTLDGLCRISISRFYRDRGVFDLLGDTVVPDLAAAARLRVDRQVRCWSAGCASGEEVYTLTILWKLRVGLEFPDVTLRVTATDDAPRMIERALQGDYSFGSLKDLPEAWTPPRLRKTTPSFAYDRSFVKALNSYCKISVARRPRAYSISCFAVIRPSRTLMKFCNKKPFAGSSTNLPPGAS